jgi:hypothetical protein
MKYVLIFLLCLVTATSALAIDEDQPNTLGLYFDAAAQRYCVSDILAPAYGTMHVILTNPTFDAVSGIEFGIDILGLGNEPGEAEFYSSVHWVAAGIDVASGNYNNIYGFAQPLLCTEITVICTMDLYYSGNGSLVRFMLHGSQPSSGDPLFPYVLTGNELYPLGITRAFGSASAVINAGDCEGVVATEMTTFGAVKSLYR